jgi:ABC-2 type transport system ATP-binding protein
MTMEIFEQTSPVLQIENLCKHYKKDVLVNDHVSLSLNEGEIFGLLGPNGAGKTTLINQIIGLVKPDSGKITLDGIDVIKNPGYARQACSFQAQSQVPISGLTARQAIELVGEIRGGDKANMRRKATELMDSLEITECENQTGETFSGGFRRLVAFCMAAVVPGRMVILDEPTNDVDPLRRRLLWKQIRNLAESGSTVLLVTHNVMEAERAVDRLAVMDKAKVLQIGRTAEIKNYNDQHIRIELVFEPHIASVKMPDYLIRPLLHGNRLVAGLAEQNVTAAIEWASDLKKEGYLEEFSLGPTTLEDAYVRIIGRQDVLAISEGGESQ